MALSTSIDLECKDEFSLEYPGMEKNEVSISENNDAVFSFLNQHISWRRRRPSINNNDDEDDDNLSVVSDLSNDSNLEQPVLSSSLQQGCSPDLAEIADMTNMISYGDLAGMSKARDKATTLLLPNAATTATSTATSTSISTPNDVCKIADSILDILAAASAGEPHGQPWSSPSTMVTSTTTTTTNDVTTRNILSPSSSSVTAVRSKNNHKTINYNEKRRGPMGALKRLLLSPVGVGRDRSSMFLSTSQSVAPSTAKSENLHVSKSALRARNRFGITSRAA